MAELNSKKWIAMSHLVYCINECSSYQDFCETLFSQIRDLIPYSKALLFQVESDADGGIHRCNPYIVVPQQDDPLLTEPIMKRTIRVSTDSYMRVPWSSVFRQSDILSSVQRTDDSVYKTLWEPQNIHFGLHFILVHHGEPVAIFTLFRSKNDMDFSEEEVKIAEALKNHLAQKLRTLLRGHNAQSDKEPAETVLSGITAREREVLLCIGAGKSNKDICKELFIEDSTLRKHLYNIYRKTGTKNRSQLILWLYQNKI